MKTLTYTKANKLDLLSDQLVAAFPEWREVVPDPPFGGTETVYKALFHLESVGNAITLRVPDDADEAAVQAVIDAHDSSDPSQSEEATAEIDTIKAKFPGWKAEPGNKPVTFSEFQDLIRLLELKLNIDIV